MLSPFGNNYRFKFIFVMVLFPVTVNVLQFWITDNIIKSDKAIEEKDKSHDISYFEEEFRLRKENSILYDIEENLNRTFILIDRK